MAKQDIDNDGTPYGIPRMFTWNLPLITFVVRILDSRQWPLSHLWKHNTDRTCAESFCLFSSSFKLPLGCHRFISAFIWILVNRWDKNVPRNMIEDQKQKQHQVQTLKMIITTTSGVHVMRQHDLRGDNCNRNLCLLVSSLWGGNNEMRMGQKWWEWAKNDETGQLQKLLQLATNLKIDCSLLLSFWGSWGSHKRWLFLSFGGTGAVFYSGQDPQSFFYSLH